LCSIIVEGGDIAYKRNVSKYLNQKIAVTDSTVNRIIAKGKILRDFIKSLQIEDKPLEI
jgi:hypothetical protein